MFTFTNRKQEIQKWDIQVQACTGADLCFLMTLSITKGTDVHESRMIQSLIMSLDE